MTPDRRREAQASNPFGGVSDDNSLNLNDMMRDMIGVQPGRVQPLPASLTPTAPAMQNGDQLVIGRFRITRVGLRIDGSVSASEWVDFGMWVRDLSSALTWVIADWMSYGQRIHGTTIEDTAAIIGKSTKTLYNWSYVSGNVDFSRRREKLTFSHHALVAPLRPERQQWYLEQAEAQQWSVAMLKRQIEMDRDRDEKDDQDGAQQQTTARPPSFRRQVSFIEHTLAAAQQGERPDPRRANRLRAYAVQLNEWTAEVLRWLEAVEGEGGDTG